MTTQPKQITDPEFPHVTFYVFEDGHASMAVHSCWVAALFESLDAAKSWARHDVEADEAFAKLNEATGGKGDLLLGPRRACVHPPGCTICNWCGFRADEAAIARRHGGST